MYRVVMRMRMHIYLVVTWLFYYQKLILNKDIGCRRNAMAELVKFTVLFLEFHLLHFLK